MHPILFEIPRFELPLGPLGTYLIGPLPIRLYGLMIGIGFLLATYLASRRAKKEGINPDRILDMGVYLLIAAIVGSRLLYVLINLREFAHNPWDVIAILKGGLVFFGGLLAAVPTGIWYVRKHNLPVWQTADIVAPYIALGHGFGRLGCFFAGCCYGAACHGPACLVFTDPQSLAPLNAALYPTQLMESGGEFLIFGLLLLMRRFTKAEGQLFWLYPLLYAILRFTVEFFRGDAARGLYFGGLLSTSQIIAVLLFGFSIFMLWRLGKNGKPRRPAAGTRTGKTPGNGRSEKERKERVRHGGEASGRG
jgi:phosphatidylglycerol:prolipoprotein diacylglycerol transferase